LHVISKKRLREFWLSHPAAEGPLRRWYSIASKAHWANLVDVRRVFPHADGVNVASGTTMTVFNLGGNNYRLVARVLYEYRRVYVRQVLTHAEYSKNRWKESL